jgi:hypothetical protein
MNPEEFRRLIPVGPPIPRRLTGVGVEIEDSAADRPIILTGMGAFTATTLVLTEDEGRELFDALAEAFGYLLAARGAQHAAGRNTPTESRG